MESRKSIPDTVYHFKTIQLFSEAVVFLFYKHGNKLTMFKKLVLVASIKEIPSQICLILKHFYSLHSSILLFQSVQLFMCRDALSACMSIHHGCWDLNLGLVEELASALNC